MRDGGSQYSYREEPPLRELPDEESLLPEELRRDIDERDFFWDAHEFSRDVQKAIFTYLCKKERYYSAASCYRFADNIQIDEQKLVTGLISQGRIATLLEMIPLLNKDGSVDLFRRIVDSCPRRLDDFELGQFLKSGIPINRSFLPLFLKMESFLWNIPLRLERFVGLTQADYKKVAKMLLKKIKQDSNKDLFLSLTTNLQKFKGLDQKTYLQILHTHLDNCEPGYAVASCLELMEAHTEGGALSLEQLLSEGVLNHDVIRFYYARRDWAEVTQEIKTAIGMHLVDKEQVALHLCQTRHFAELKILLEEQILEDFPIYFEEESEWLLDEFEKEKFTMQAVDLCECLALAGRPVEKNRHERIIKNAEGEQEKREHRQKREIDEEDIELLDEIVEFYVNEFIYTQTSLLLENEQYRQLSELVRRRPFELPFRDMVTVADLRNGRKRHTDTLFRFMREYAVYATNHVTHHQADLHDPINDATIPADLFMQGDDLPGREPDDRFLEVATEEEIREYLKRFERRYGESWGQEQKIDGGEPWAVIAKTTAEAWKEGADPFMMIDRFVDLEHNNGMIFDKRPQRVHQNSILVTRFLGFKRNAVTIDEWVQNLDKFVTGRKYEALHSRLMTLKQLKPKIDRMVSELGLEE